MSNFLHKEWIVSSILGSQVKTGHAQITEVLEVPQVDGSNTLETLETSSIGAVFMLSDKRHFIRAVFSRGCIQSHLQSHSHLPPAKLKGSVIQVQNYKIWPNNEKTDFVMLVDGFNYVSCESSFTFGSPKNVLENEKVAEKLLDVRSSSNQVVGELRPTVNECIISNSQLHALEAQKDWLDSGVPVTSSMSLSGDVGDDEGVEGNDYIESTQAPPERNRMRWIANSVPWQGGFELESEESDHEPDINSESSLVMDIPLNQQAMIAPSQSQNGEFPSTQEDTVAEIDENPNILADDKNERVGSTLIQSQLDGPIQMNVGVAGIHHVSGDSGIVKETEYLGMGAAVELQTQLDADLDSQILFAEEIDDSNTLDQSPKDDAVEAVNNEITLQNNNSGRNKEVPLSPVEMNFRAFNRERLKRRRQSTGFTEQSPEIDRAFKTSVNYLTNLFPSLHRFDPLADRSKQQPLKVSKEEVEAPSPKRMKTNANKVLSQSSTTSPSFAGWMKKKLRAGLSGVLTLVSGKASSSNESSPQVIIPDMMYGKENSSSELNSSASPGKIDEGELGGDTSAGRWLRKSAK